MSAMLIAEGERFVPTERARGYWSSNSIQGRVLVGIVGHVLNARHGGDGFLPARLTVDMHRMAPFAPFTIQSRVIRDGGRLRLAEAVLAIEGQEYVHATCQFLRDGMPPEPPRWSGGNWDAPHPETLPPMPPEKGITLFDWRNISGHMGSPPPRRMWMREVFDLIEGVALSPWDRLVAGVDFASPWAHGVPFDPGYMNTDVTLQVHRMPRGEWIGFEATGHEASRGVAVGQCRIHDIEGPIGFAATTALHQPRGA